MYKMIARVDNSNDMNLKTFDCKTQNMHRLFAAKLQCVLKGWYILIHHIIKDHNNI